MDSKQNGVTVSVSSVIVVRRFSTSSLRLVISVKHGAIHLVAITNAVTEENIEVSEVESIVGVIGKELGAGLTKVTIAYLKLEKNESVGREGCQGNRKEKDMSRNNEDASASWNGYMYQGKVSLLFALKKINELEDKGESLELWSLGIEHSDDFELRCNNKAYSIHQVKNYKGGQFSKYQKALIKLAIKEETCLKYLHTRTPIESGWQEKFGEISSEYEVQKYKDITDEDALEFLAEYRKFYKFRDTKKRRGVKEPVSEVAIIIKKYLYNNPTIEECMLSIEKIKGIFEKYGQEREDEIEKLSNINIPGFIGGLQLPKAMTSEEVKEDCINEIEKKWGKRAEYKKESRDLYYIKLIDEINKLVTQKTEEKREDFEIPLKHIENILNQVQFYDMDKEQKLLQYKDKIEKAKDDYCARCKDTCDSEECSVESVVIHLLRQKIEEFEKTLRIISISNAQKLDERGSEIINHDRLKKVFFKILNKVTLGFTLDEYKVIARSEDNKYIMASGVSEEADDEDDVKLVVETLSRNSQIDELLKDVTIKMEIDEVVTKDIEMTLQEYRPSVIDTNGDEAAENMTYYKITNNKNLSLIRMNTAYQKYGKRGESE